MGKIKARKVSTPGSGSTPNSRPAHRPKKIDKNKRKGATRKNNYRCRYSKEDMVAALKVVSEKKMGIRQAAKEFKVPKSTLSDLASGATKVNLGRPTVLSEEEELVIVERLILLSSWGFPLSKRNLCVLIQEYLEMKGRATRFII